MHYFLCSTYMHRSIESHTSHGNFGEFLGFLVGWICHPDTKVSCVDARSPSGHQKPQNESLKIRKFWYTLWHGRHARKDLNKTLCTRQNMISVGTAVWRTVNLEPRTYGWWHSQGHQEPPFVDHSWATCWWQMHKAHRHRCDTRRYCNTCLGCFLASGMVRLTTCNGKNSDVLCWNGRRRRQRNAIWVAN